MQKYHDMNVYEYDSLVIMAKNLVFNLYEIKKSLPLCCSDNL